MKKVNLQVIAISAAMLMGAAQVANSAVPNTFNAGTPAKASEINANFSNLDARFQALSGSEIAVDCSSDSQALINADLQPNNTYVLTGTCDGPIEIFQPAGNYSFKGDASGSKDDGIALPIGSTDSDGNLPLIAIWGAVHVGFENLSLSAASHASALDNLYVSVIENAANVSLADVSISGGDAGILSYSNGVVFLEDNVSVSGFNREGLAAVNNGVIHAWGSGLSVAGSTSSDDGENQALFASRGGVIQIRRGGTISAGNGSSIDADERYSVSAGEGGVISIAKSGTVTLNGYVGAFRNGTVRMKTGTVSNGGIYAGDGGVIRLDNVTQSGGLIDLYRGGILRTHNSNLINTGSDIFTVWAGSIANLREGSRVGDASGTARIYVNRYSVLVLQDNADLGGRDIQCSNTEALAFNADPTGPDVVNIGTISC